MNGSARVAMLANDLRTLGLRRSSDGALSLLREMSLTLFWGHCGDFLIVFADHPNKQPDRCSEHKKPS
jgi:hypothetical protein